MVGREVGRFSFEEWGRKIAATLMQVLVPVSAAAERREGRAAVEDPMRRWRGRRETSKRERIRSFNVQKSADQQPSYQGKIERSGEGGSGGLRGGGSRGAARKREGKVERGPVPLAEGGEGKERRGWEKRGVSVDRSAHEQGCGPSDAND